MPEKDTVEEYQGSTIQHGPYNNRIYLMRLAEHFPTDFPWQLIRLAESGGYSKIFAKVPESAAAGFLQAGFVNEAEIPGFFSGRMSALFMGYYLDTARKQEDDVARLENILHIAEDKRETAVPPPDARFRLRPCRREDVPAMAAIYRQTFASYPFPIHEESYLLETMRSRMAYYFGAENKGELAALASAEMDREAGNAEMTDFSALPEQAGHNLSLHLLRQMERTMRAERIRTAYTIARAASPAMNITFARAGYRFAGRLKNNTNISGRIESMNVWYKPLVQPSETTITHLIYYMDNQNQLLKQRREKAQSLVDAGVNIFSNHFKNPQAVRAILPLAERLEPETHASDEIVYRVAGRVMSLRKFGKAAFFHIQDESGRMQVYVSHDLLGEEFQLFKKWDVGDIVGVEGKLFKTKTGEPSLEACRLHMITKSLRPLPEKFHGLTDVETRYRQRYVDLIVNPEVRETFRKRVEIIRLMREFLTDRGFMEVETPMMQPVPGGAAAKPFKTHHNALDMDLFLRIAPELYLKRLVVGGFERVFEINRNFRNEGLSTRHNPEFTMLEFYQAYATYEDLMDLTEEMISSVATKVCGSSEIVYQGIPVNLAPPWKCYTMDEALVEVGGIDPELLKDDATVMGLAKKHGIKLQPDAGPGKAKTDLFELLVEEKLIDPTFITAYPAEVSPLARRNEDDPTVTDRFELFITGRELANAFSELNDPVDQHERFAKQIEERGDDEEIHPELDADYVRALEYGMPSAAGEGIGIDRLVMLLTDSPSIRDVILFPHLKAEVVAETKKKKKKS